MLKFRSILCAISFFAVYSATSRAAEYDFDSGWEESSCYRGLELRVVVKKAAFRDADTQEARLFIRNRYPKNLSVNYKFDVNGKSNDGRFTIRSGEEASGGAWSYVPRASSFRVSAVLSKAKAAGASDYSACDQY
jgi:hypothetical protein